MYISTITKGGSTVNKSKPTVIIEVQGGCVAGIVADGSVRCVVVDHDTDGVDRDRLHKYPVAKGRIEDVGAADWGTVDKDAGFVKAALKTLKL
jgi:hypothetical protein